MGGPGPSAGLACRLNPTEPLDQASSSTVPAGRRPAPVPPVTQANEASSGIRQLPRVVAIGGGLPIESAGALVGGIGVSGAPGGEADDVCARAGVAAIKDDLDF